MNIKSGENMLGIKIDDAGFALIRRVAAEEERTMSAVVRRALREYVEKYACEQQKTV